MEPKPLPSPVRRSATPEQPIGKSSAGHQEGALLQTTNNSSPANKKQRGNGEGGDGPLNLSKPKGTVHTAAEDLRVDFSFIICFSSLLSSSGQGGSPTPPSTPSSTPTPLTSTASLTSSRMFPGQNHMLHGSGLLFPGHFLPYPAMPPHLSAMNFTGNSSSTNVFSYSNFIVDLHMQNTFKGNKMGFNPPSGAMGVNDRILGSDKLHGSMNSNNGGEPTGPFPTMPFFLPSLNGNALQNMANNTGNMAAAGDRSHQSEAPAKQQREGSSGNRNSELNPKCRFCISTSVQTNWLIIWNF